jgi:hypothetical protein
MANQNFGLPQSAAHAIRAGEAVVAATFQQTEGGDPRAAIREIESGR